MKVLLYCTKGKPNLYRPFEFDCFEEDEASRFYLANKPMLKEDTLLNGKIVAECDCYNVEKIIPSGRDFEQVRRICRDGCLTINELISYQGDNQFLYALNLSNVKVFDKPKELYDYDVKPKPFKTFDGWSITNITYSCTIPPQNMRNVYDRFGNHYVLISVQPQHLCKILNGEKTIEVRKKILNSLEEEFNCGK